MTGIYCGHDVSGKLVVFSENKEDKDWADKLFEVCHGIVPGIERVVTNRGLHGVRSAETRQHHYCQLWLEAGENGPTPQPIKKDGIAVHVIKD